MDMVLSNEEKKNQKIAGVLTALITALVLLLLIILTFSSKALLDIGDDGVMVQMGDPNMGGPDNTPQTEQLVPVKPQVVESSDNTMTTNQDDGVVIDESDKKKPNRQTQQQTQQETQTEPEQKVETALEKAMREAREAQQNSKGQGDGTQTGTQGEPDGKGTSPTGGGTGTVGTGSGNFELGSGFGDRRLSYAPNMVSKCTGAKGGVVVLRIEVLPNGTIISAKGGERGTTVFDDCLMKEAEQMALRVRLSSTNQPGNMIGNLSIRFRN
jgi:outer membrane biosynthesis protein TonB